MKRLRHQKKRSEKEKLDGGEHDGVEWGGVRAKHRWTNADDEDVDGGEGWSGA